MIVCIKTAMERMTTKMRTARPRMFHGVALTIRLVVVGKASVEVVDQKERDEEEGDTRRREAGVVKEKVADEELEEAVYQDEAEAAGLLVVEELDAGEYLELPLVMEAGPAVAVVVVYHLTRRLATSEERRYRSNGGDEPCE
jgi:hypothetical protein